MPSTGLEMFCGAVDPRKQNELRKSLWLIQFIMFWRTGEVGGASGFASSQFRVWGAPLPASPHPIPRLLRRPPLTKAMPHLCVLVAAFLYPSKIARCKRNHMCTVKAGAFELCCRLAIRRNHFNTLSGSALKKTRRSSESLFLWTQLAPARRPPEPRPEPELARRLGVIKIHNARTGWILGKKKCRLPPSNTFQPR